ncbi:MAG: YqaA family protein [Bacteroidales bacterium]
MKNRIKLLYDWSQWANTRWGASALFICAFADASFMPLPTPMFFLALTLLNMTKAYKYAFSATLGTLFGAVAGYSIGHFAWLTANGEFTVLAQFLFNHIPGFSESVFNNINTQFLRWDLWVLFVASFVPVPYKIFSISSGVFDINVFIFCFATFFGQAIKFYLLAFLTIKMGPKVKKLFEIKFKFIAIIATASIAVAIVVYRVL